jgi:hypothetical protein
MKFYQSPLVIAAFIFFILAIYSMTFGQGPMGFGVVFGIILLVVAFFGILIHLILKAFLKKFITHLLLEFLVLFLFMGWVLINS